MASDELQLNDPITVENSDQPLEGIVAHLGPVEFAPGDDWIGIRLTGTSVGKGKNDGSVKGVNYFDVGTSGSSVRGKNGMFVKSSNVKKRKLSKLEELKLRRELGLGSAAAGGRSSISGGGSSAAASRTVKSPMASKTPPKITTTSAIPTAGGGGSRKLDELRARREALAKERGGTSSRGERSSRDSLSTPGTNTSETKEDSIEEGDEDTEESKDDNEESTAAATESESTSPKVNLQTATPGYRAELSRLQGKISSLENDLKKKNAENTSLQSSLDFMSKGAEQSTHDAVRMYAMGALALTEAKSSSTPGKSGTPGAKSKRSLDAEMKMEESDSDEDSDSEEESGSEDGGENEGVVNQAAAAVSQALVERNNELTSQLSNLNATSANLQHQLSEAEERIANIQLRYEQTTENYTSEKQLRLDELQTFATDKSVLTSQVTSLERELHVLQERVSDKSNSQDHSHVTLAKLRADLTSYQRKNEDLSNDKMELEVTLEELVLDKEQLGQDKEMIEDQLEECKIDLESAQLELEDAKAQLEEGTAAINAAVEGGTGDSEAKEGDADASAADSQDAIRSLTLQNTRLRTALIRLREQSELERNELQRQLKAYQSDTANSEEIQAELDSLKSAHASTLAEIRELKDVIDQTTSLEETIETLSDKVWNLDETNANLERTVRELEESAEIAAEMEEVQADELKMVMRDLEGRDALVGNLEEAIRMQRRREEDFQRYVSEFRTSISTLKQEKAALLALTDDNQGEKSHLLATSKKALAQAAQLASDAAEARQRSSDAAFQMIAARSATYLSQRLETLLPSGVVSSELAAVKGEMSLAKVADKAAVSLTAVEEVFNKAIDKGFTGISEFNTLEDGASMSVSDAASQQIAVMMHQASFANMTIEAATDALRLMAAGQWPELLSQEVSTDLGSVVGHSVALDLALSEQLKLLKSDGVLSPLRSSLSDLDQAVNNTRLALFSATDETGKTVIPADWKPPGWEALKSLSLGRFACLGATAVLSSAVSPMEDADNEPPPATPQNLAEVLTKANQSCVSMLDVCKKLAGVRLNDTDTLNSLDEQSIQYHTSSLALFECVKTAFDRKLITITSEDVGKFSVLLEKVLSAARPLAALVRKAGLGDHDTSNHHYLSAEFGDSWGGVTEMVGEVRGIDGDSEDVNYLMRARAIENQLAVAVENEPKLDIANVKIASLEKSLSSRSKEINMQNSRLAELETLLARASSATPMSPLKVAPGPSVTSADTLKLKEEVRMLQEALDVMQKQSEEYEKEIRSLKDKSRPSRGVRTAGGRVTPKKAPMDLEATLNQLGQTAGPKSVGSSSRDVLLESISLETALYRPALSSAVQSANFWKTKAMGSALSKLAPLNVPIATQSIPSSTCNEARKMLDDLLSQGQNNVHISRGHCMDELALARNEVRLAKASFSIVDLSKNDLSSRAQLNEKQQKEHMAGVRLEKVTSSWLKSAGYDSLASFLPSSSESMGGNSLGRITVPCRDGAGFVAPLTVNNAELRNLHSFLVQ